MKCTPLSPFQIIMFGVAMLMLISCSTKVNNERPTDFSKWYGTYDFGDNQVLRIQNMLGYDLPFAVLISGDETHSLDITLSKDGSLMINGNLTELKDNAISCSIVTDGSVESVSYPRINDEQVALLIEAKKQSDLIESTVEIGEQIWMGSDLNITQYSNGDPIQQAQSEEEWKKCSDEKIGCWCYFNNDKNQNVLYNWYAVIDARGLAPKGWKIPSYDDFMTLATFLGGESKAGIQMKSDGFHPPRDNDGSVNFSRFNAVGTGYRQLGWKPSEFRGKATNGVGELVFYWAISSHPESMNNFQPRAFGLYIDSRRLDKNVNVSLADGLTVRCVK